jgi:hypothetical protein
MAVFGQTYVIYFLAVIVVGNFLFLNVFLAVLASRFESAGAGEAEETGPPRSWRQWWAGLRVRGRQGVASLGCAPKGAQHSHAGASATVAIAPAAGAATGTHTPVFGAGKNERGDGGSPQAGAGGGDELSTELGSAAKAPAAGADCPSAVSGAGRRPSQVFAPGSPAAALGASLAASSRFRGGATGRALVSGAHGAFGTGGASSRRVAGGGGGGGGSGDSPRGGVGSGGADSSVPPAGAGPPGDPLYVDGKAAVPMLAVHNPLLRQAPHFGPIGARPRRSVVATVLPLQAGGAAAAAVAAPAASTFAAAATRPPLPPLQARPAAPAPPRPRSLSQAGGGGGGGAAADGRSVPGADVTYRMRGRGATRLRHSRNHQHAAARQRAAGAAHGR